MVAVAKNVTQGTNSTEKFTDKVKRFFKGSWAEFKKVHWPNKKELYTYTGVVLLSVLIVSVLIWIVDSALSYVLELIL